jgi:hypothetical protein
MKHCMVLILLLHYFVPQAQNDSILFEKNTVLNKGIYTSFYELLSNAPKYPGYEMDVTNYTIFYQPVRYFLNMNKIQQEYHDTFFAVAKDKI